MFHLQFGDGAFLTQDVSLAVVGWCLLVCHSSIAISISAAILILHYGPQYFGMGRSRAMHFDEEMGFKFWGLGSTVFSPSN